MTVTIGRRELLVALGGAAAAWPLAARAQQTGKLPMIGLIGADPTSWGPWTAAFAARLAADGDARALSVEFLRCGQPDPAVAAGDKDILVR
jgi:hypothetical protein